VEYNHFENSVMNIVNAIDYKQHKHLLSSLQEPHRNRCLNTLNLGFSIPEAITHINTASKLPDKNYLRYLKFIQSQKVAGIW